VPDNKTGTLIVDIVKQYLPSLRQRVHLEKIEASYTGDDQVLFQGIRQAYDNTRKSPTPGYYTYVPGFLGSLFGETSFSRRELVNFVRAFISLSHIPEDE
jgi:hypothetical protein